MPMSIESVHNAHRQLPAVPVPSGRQFSATRSSEGGAREGAVTAVSSRNLTGPSIGDLYFHLLSAEEVR
jgi:hypothetical protein